ncbi:hypothetical protein NA56DRAFT_578013 [Hyaloscypha hepaticicola]|uniref:Zn(2)-C6 fungal-type domain-containing protein n=1 Tax=Hyaloscypha hepaticicola TaxID=2082293 RepID=A0A2J6PV68_9HELO|nr:hypothetical protein NA56DRAFT_578013 [Hyaloscypha hepaticicola]
MTRQRTTLACEICRSRRTKCDGRRPTCSFCEGHGIQCTYQSAAPPVPSKNELEIYTIRERLDQICDLLSLRLASSFAMPPNAPGIKLPRFDDYPLDESIISRNWRVEFPFMTIQTPSMMCLVGLNPQLAAQMVALERTDLSMLTPPGDSPGFRIQYQDAISAFTAFYEKIYHCYPVLNPEFFSLYLEKIVGNVAASTDSFLVLVVAAIGSVVRCSSIAVALEKRPDAAYIATALSMLPNVHFEFSLSSVQCLLLLSIYYNCLAKPCQAHDYVLMASCKAQALFKCHLYANDNTATELLRRSFWSILVIETELGYHIDMPESNIWKFDDRILLPGIHGSWQPFRDDQRHLLDQTLLSTGITPNDMKAYFLADISMRRMIRRCTTSVIISQDRETYAPIVAAELAQQLDSWYHHLPLSLGFERPISNLAFPDASFEYAEPYQSSSLSSVRGLLKIRYYMCLTGIYWPAVYSVVYTDTASPATLADCSRFFQAYIGFVSNVALAIQSSPHCRWSIYARYISSRCL